MKDNIREDEEAEDEMEGDVGEDAEEEDNTLSIKRQLGAKELTDVTILSLNSNSNKKIQFARYSDDDDDDDDDMNQLTDTVTKDRYEGSDSGI